MAQFLTDEWIGLALEVYESVEEVPDELKMINTALRLRVHKIPPDGESETFFIIVDEGIVIDLGRGEPPVEADATIEGDFEVAKGLVLGDLPAEKALTSGKVSVQGDIGKLVGFAAQQSHDVSRDVAARVKALTD